MSNEREMLEASERRRLWRFKAGVFFVAIGVMTAALGLLLRDDGGAAVTAAGGWMIMGGAVLALIAMIAAWANRPGENARRLDALGGRADRVQRLRTRQLTVIPGACLIFASLAAPAVERILEGGMRRPDWLMALVAPLYAWVLIMIVMGWNRMGRDRRLLEDEFSQALRAKAVTFGFCVLMAGATAAYVVGLFRPDIAVIALPVVIGAGAAAAGLRFAWLDREAERDG